MVYYPSNHWYSKSTFINCNDFSMLLKLKPPVGEVNSPVNKNEVREEIIFADLNDNNKREENEPVVVMRADNYQRLFKIHAPLTRMLRRQIDNHEYIALSHRELINSDINKDNIYFVVPIVKMLRGYYATEMKMVTLGKIIERSQNENGSTEDAQPLTSHVIYFEGKPFIHLRSTSQLIRWLGL